MTGNGKKSVLVVEDDLDVREALQDLLGGEGYDVLVAGDGREALEILRGPARPGLILLDLMMPVMNGWQVLDSLKRDESLAQIPVVVLTAAAREKPEGAVGFIRKPIHLESLLETVAAHCGD